VKAKIESYEFPPGLQKGSSMRIVDALCMVTACALGFAMYRGLTPPLNDRFRSFGLFYDLAMGVALGLILTAGVTLTWRCPA
jgi:hypothetical protein